MNSNAAARDSGCAVEIYGRTFLLLSLIIGLLIWLAIPAVKFWLGLG